MEIDNINLTATSYKQKWMEEWKLYAFRKRFVTVLITLFLVVTVNPYFFSYIQQRNGIELNDWLLNFIPSMMFPYLFFVFCGVWSC